MLPVQGHLWYYNRGSVNHAVISPVVAMRSSAWYCAHCPLQAFLSHVTTAISSSPHFAAVRGWRWLPPLLWPLFLGTRDGHLKGGPLYSTGARASVVHAGSCNALNIAADRSNNSMCGVFCIVLCYIIIIICTMYHNCEQRNHSLNVPSVLGMFPKLSSGWGCVCCHFPSGSGCTGVRGWSPS